MIALPGPLRTVPKSEESQRFDWRASGISAHLNFEAWSPQAPLHVVNLENSTCTCNHYVLTHTPCKHMFAVLKRSAQSWSTLPLSLLQHPWLNIDYKVRIPQIQLSSRRLFWFWITKFLGRASLTSQVVNSSGTAPARKQISQHISAPHSPPASNSVPL